MQSFMNINETLLHVNHLWNHFSVQRNSGGVWICVMVFLWVIFAQSVQLTIRNEMLMSNINQSSYMTLWNTRVSMHRFVSENKLTKSSLIINSEGKDAPYMDRNKTKIFSLNYNFWWTTYNMKPIWEEHIFRPFYFSISLNKIYNLLAAFQRGSRFC